MTQIACHAYTCRTYTYSHYSYKDCKWHGGCSYVLSSVERNEANGKTPRQVRGVMAALLPILVIIAFVGTLPPPGGKAGW